MCEDTSVDDTETVCMNVTGYIGAYHTYLITLFDFLQDE